MDRRVKDTDRKALYVAQGVGASEYWRVRAWDIYVNCGFEGQWTDRPAKEEGAT